jgi:hypothetical protein
MDSSRYNLTLYTFRQLMVFIFFLAIMNGCAAVSPTAPPSSVPPDSPPPVEYKPVTGPATSLFIEAEKALQAGRLAESEILLERALRVEARNPHYWHAMAQVKYRQGQYRETVQFCLKAESLAGKQPQLMARNKELLQQAKQAIQSE